MAKKTTVSIDISSLDLDKLANDRIMELEKQVRSLERKLKTREQKITDLQSGMDVTKEKRAEIRDLANQLVDSLEWNGWVNIQHGL
jgi:sugar-specific transcriptional regulator TrmB